MNLKKLIRKFLSEILKESGIEIVSYETKGNDQKTGETVEVVRAESQNVHILFEKRDGTIEIKLKPSRDKEFKYLSQISLQASKEMTIDELLRKVPNSPLSSKELLQHIAPELELAIKKISAT